MTTTEFPSAVAKARFVRVSPRKARRVIDLVRGRSVADAQNNNGLDPATLVVATVYADEGPTAKRIRPRAQGRAFRIRKRTSHITVVVESRPGKDQGSAKSTRARRAEASKAASKAPAKKAPAKKAPAKKAATKAPAKKAATKATAEAKTSETSDAKGGSD